MAFGVTFNVLKILGERKAGNRKISRQPRSAKEESLGIELTVTSGSFNSKTMRPCGQCSTTPTLMKSRYRRERVIKTIAMKIFLEKTKGNFNTEFGKKTGIQMPGSVPINYKTVLLMSIIS